MLKEMAALFQAQGLKDSPNKVTTDEAIRRNYICINEPPKPQKCKFCGSTLYYEGAVLGNRVMAWFPAPQRCICPGSVEYWKRADAEHQRRLDEVEEQRRRDVLNNLIERLLGKSGIKKRFARRTFENFIADTPERRHCYDIAKEYANKFSEHYKKGEGLYIEGTNGTGKTHLAAAIALQLIGQGIPVICKTSTNMLADIKSSFDDGGFSEKEVLRAYKEVDLLIIDDLGKEQCTDWTVSTLYAIINDRYEDLKPTIITTNYNAESLVSALTPKGCDSSKITAVLSRLKEVSSVMAMVWEDYRCGGPLDG